MRDSANRLLMVLAAVVAVLVIAIVVVSVVLIAAGSSGGSSASPAKSNSGPPAAAGNAFRLGGSDPLTLDPAQSFDVDSARYIVEIFGGLVQLDKNLKVIPDIAERWDVSQPDAQGQVTYTFHLRKDVAFSRSHRRVTAADFKYSWERALNPKTNSPVADTYLGDIVGAHAYEDGQASDVSGIKVVDDSTLQVTIKQAEPYFLDKLTYTVADVVNKDQVEKNPRGWTLAPDGTGPFILAKYDVGQQLILEANSSYHLGKPAVPEVRFDLAGGGGLTQYQAGEVDITGVGINDIESIRDPNNPLHQQFQESTALGVFYLAFNTQVAPFDDPKVREAFALAVDRDKIASVVLKDIAKPADRILPPGMPLRSDAVKGLSYDPARAKQLLQESRYNGKLPRLQLYTSGAGANADVETQAIVQQLKDNLGVDIEIQQVEPATFLQDAKRGRYAMWVAGWSADYPDPEDFLDVLFYSKSKQNDFRYSNAQVDDLLVRARTEQDKAKREQLYAQAEQLIVNDAPVAPLTYDADNALVKPYVKGFFLPGMIIPWLRYISIQRG